MKNTKQTLLGILLIGSLSAHLALPVTPAGLLGEAMVASAWGIGLGAVPTAYVAHKVADAAVDNAKENKLRLEEDLKKMEHLPENDIRKSMLQQKIKDRDALNAEFSRTAKIIKVTAKVGTIVAGATAYLLRRGGLSLILSAANSGGTGIVQNPNAF